MNLERNDIMDDFKILAFYQDVLEWMPEMFESGRFHWDPIDGLGDCVLDKSPWNWKPD